MFLFHVIAFAVFLTLGLTTWVFHPSSQFSEKEDLAPGYQKLCIPRKKGATKDVVLVAEEQLAFEVQEIKRLHFEVHYEFMNFDMQSPPGMRQIYINHF